MPGQAPRTNREAQVPNIKLQRISNLQIPKFQTASLFAFCWKLVLGAFFELGVWSLVLSLRSGPEAHPKALRGLNQDFAKQFFHTDGFGFIQPPGEQQRDDKS